MSVNALAEAVREGKEVLVGSGTLTGGTLAVDTPFAVIDAAVATNLGTAATIAPWAAVDSNVVTFTGDSGEDISYIIVGRRR